MDSTVVVQPNNSTIKMAGEKVMPILYYIPPSPPCRAVLLLGRLLNIEFELRFLDILNGEQLKPEFVEINPQHSVPTLEEHGLVLYESRAILAYLVSSYGKDDTLYPQDVRMRALVDQRVQFDLGTLYARLTAYMMPVILHGSAIDENNKQRLNEALGFFDSMLKGRTWAAINNFTIADLTLTVTVAQIEMIGIDLDPYTRVRTWLKRCTDHLSQYGYDEIQQGGIDLAAIFKAKSNPE